jgi:hypothetical protein
MPAPPKRSTADLSKELEARAEQAEIERIDALSDEELDRELREAGIDADFAEEIPYFVAAPPEDPSDEGGGVVAPRRGKPAAPARRVWPWVAAVLVVVIAVAAIAMRR